MARFPNDITLFGANGSSDIRSQATADRTLLLPNKDCTLAGNDEFNPITSDIHTYNNRQVYWNFSLPSIGSRPDGALWFEPGAQTAPMPWQWNATSQLWISQPLIATLPVATYAISSQTNMRVDYPLVLDGANHRVFIRSIWRIGNPVSAMSGTASWNFAFGWWDGTANSTVTLNTFPTTTFTSAGTSYRSSFSLNNFYTNPFGLFLTASKNGSPGAIYMTYNVQYFICKP